MNKEGKQDFWDTLYVCVCMCTRKKNRNYGQAPIWYSGTLLSSSGSNIKSFEYVKFYSSSSFSTGFVHLSCLISFQKLRRGVASDAFTIIALFSSDPFKHGMACQN